MKPNDGSGIISWHFEPSDDGNFALVEFVAVNKAALASILAANAPGLKAFERGKSKKDDVEKAFKALKKNLMSTSLWGRRCEAGRDAVSARRRLRIRSAL